MKTFATIMKIVAAMAVIAGIVYVVATYGDRIVSWARGLWAKYGWGCCCDDDCCCDMADTSVQADALDFEV